MSKEVTAVPAQGNYWAVLTAPILESREISDGAKLFYAQVSRRTNALGYCWASNKALSEDLGIGERTVSRYVAELEAEGFILTEQVGVSDRKRRIERRIRLAVPSPFNLAKNGDVKVAKNGEVKVAKIGEAKVAKNGELKVAKNGDPYKENNNSYNNTPYNPPTGGRRAKTDPEWKPERFNAFWDFYRSRICEKGRIPALRAWDKLRPSDELIDEIARALLYQLEHDEEWARGIGRPHASTYLNQRRWEELPKAKPASDAAPGEGKEFSYGWE